jgi:hypothetical protein
VVKKDLARLHSYICSLYHVLLPVVRRYKPQVDPDDG